MATSAMLGAGSSIEVNDGAGATYVAFAEVISLSSPSTELPEVDVTHLASTAHEYIPGLRDNSEFDFQQNYTIANLTRNKALEGVSKLWKIKYTDVGTISFAGFVKKTAVDAVTPEAEVSMTTTVRVTGAIT